MKFTLLMITHNKEKFLDLSIPAIYSSFDDSFNHEFIVMNNGSTDGTQAVLERLSARYPIHVISNSENVGLNGYSVAYKASSGDIIVTVDDDIFWVSRYWERVFGTVLNSDFDGSKFAYVGSSTVNRDGGMIDSMWGAASVSGIDIILSPVGGWFAAIKRDILDSIGGFHEGKSLFHLEDADIQRRAWTVGYLCGICSPISVFHARGEGYFKALGHSASYKEREKILAAEK